MGWKTAYSLGSSNPSNELSPAQSNSSQDISNNFLGGSLHFSTIAMRPQNWETYKTSAIILAGLISNLRDYSFMLFLPKHTSFRRKVNKTLTLKNNVNLHLASQNIIEKSLAVRKEQIYGLKSINSESISQVTKKLIDVELHKLIKEHPNLRNKIKEIVFDDLGNDIARACVNKKLELKLKFNKNLFCDEKLLQKFIDEQSSEFSKKDGLYGYIKHEITHLLEYEYAIKQGG